MTAWAFARRRSTLELRPLTIFVVGAALLLALLAGPLASVSPLALVTILASGSVVLVVAIHPPLATYIVLGVTPLVAGMNRGEVVPVLRPSEAVNSMPSSIP